VEREEQITQIERLLAQLDTGTTVDAGGLRRNPTSVYTDPDLAARERAELFRGRPQLIGLSGELAAPGSFVTFDELGVPILAVRDGHGRFRAFVNTCRHRGAVVEPRPRGVAEQFACPFHAWVYDTGGCLVSVNRPGDFGEVDPDCLGLVELPAVEAHGLLWVHPEPGADLDPDSLLGPALTAELAAWDLGTLAYLDDDRWEVACNWKLAMDSFGEAYHFERLHPETVSPAFHAHVHGYDAFGPHHRMILCNREIDALRHEPRERWEITRAARVAYWLFPNVQLMPFAEGAYVLRAFPNPVDPGRHVTRITFYARPDADVDGDVLAIVVHQFAGTIRDEDFAMAVSQQRSAASGLVPEVVFGRNEPALHHFHETYREALGLPALPLLEALP
jgi:phenylpropionate dioxygenase-like ring-hydroxylating dioxygenase large terminal subunit